MQYHINSAMVWLVSNPQDYAKSDNERDIRMINGALELYLFEQCVQKRSQEMDRVNK